MLKKVFWVVLGAVGALQGERWVGGLKARFSPRAVTDGFLDKVNRRLEDSRGSSQAPGPGF